MMPPMAPPLPSDPCPFSCKLGTWPSLSEAELTGSSVAGGDVKFVDKLTGAGMLVIKGKACDVISGKCCCG